MSTSPDTTVTIHRWPRLSDTGGAQEKRRIERTAKPLQTLTCPATIAGALAHVTFPNMGGVWQFRLSSGLPTDSKILDYVLDEVSVKELRALRETIKKEQKSK